MGSLATRTRAGCIVVLVGLASVVVRADGDPPTKTRPAVTRTKRSDEVPRVRVLSPQIALGFQEGISRSPTFRSLVDAIDASNGVVYVEYGVCKSVSRSCLPGSIIVAGPSRILRVVIRETQLADDLVVSLGHELQHAVEILGDPAVTTPAQILFLFRKIGIRSGDMYETYDAIKVGEAISRELAVSARRGGDTLSQR
jgi:hypothetical protein